MNPTIDIWSLGCVFSEALVWAVYGEERLAKYRTLRSTEIDQVNGLKEAGYGTCFHNGREMLSAVATMLKNACNDRRHHDYVSEALARMIERMLQPPQYRLDAMQVYNECQQVLRGAEEKLSRKAPRESFPEVFQTRPNEVLSPPDQSGIPQTPPESPIGCGLGFSVMDSIISNDNSDIGGSPLSSPLSNGAGADRPPVATYLHGSAPKPDEPSQRPTLLTSNPPSSSGHTKPPSTSVQRVHFWMQDKKEKSPASLDGLDCAGALADRDHVSCS